jgi:hypothetical protein
MKVQYIEFGFTLLSLFCDELEFCELLLYWCLLTRCLDNFRIGASNIATCWSFFHAEFADIVVPCSFLHAEFLAHRV